MSIAIAITTWNKPITLINTLESYKKNGLLELVNERMLWCQEKKEFHENIGDHYGFEVYGGPQNLGAGWGFLRLTELCKSEYILMLEHDFELIEPIEITWKELSLGKKLLKDGIASSVRYRHRKIPGDPLFSMDMKDNESVCLPLLFESVYFYDNPAEKFPNVIKQDQSGAYLTNCNYSMYTNNPTMYRTEWFYNNVVRKAPQMGEDLYSGLENSIVDVWSELDHTVAHVPIGLFKHNDLGK